MSSRDARGEPWDGGPPGADSDYEDPRLTPMYSKNENRSRSQWQGSHSGYGQHPVNQHYNYATKYSNVMYQDSAKPQAAYDYSNASYQSPQHTVPSDSRKSRSRTPKSPKSRTRRKDDPVKKTSYTRSKRRSSSSSSSSSSNSSSSSQSSSKSPPRRSSSGSASSNRKRRQKKSTSHSSSTPRRSPSTPPHSPSTPPRSRPTPANSLSPPPRTSTKSIYRENTSPYNRNVEKKYSEENSYKHKDSSPISKYDHKDKSPSYKYKHSPQRKRREHTPPKRRWDNSSSRSYKYRPNTTSPRERASRSPDRKRYMDNDRKDKRRNYHRNSSSESERKFERTYSRKSPASKREAAKDVHKSDVDRAKKLAQDCQSNTDNELSYESMPSPEFKPLDIISHAKTQPSNLRSEFDSMKMKTEANLHQPALSSAPQFKNDGSFLEMFKKMQEEAAKSVEPAATSTESATFAPAGIKKPTLPFIGKRRGGKVLKTGIVKKAKAIDEQLVDNTPKDAWSLYMQEVKKYRDTSCEEERKTRPLVK